MGSNLSRRQMLRLGAGVTGTALLGSIAGCSGSIPGLGGGGGGGGPDISRVPSGQNALTTVNIDGLLNDNTLRDVANTSMEQSQSTGGPKNVDEAIQQFEDESGLDADGMNHLVAFGSGSTGMGAESEGAGVIQTDYTEDELVSALNEQNDTELSESEYEGHTVYQSTSGDSYLGVLGNGDFAVGTKQQVETVIDVERGEADSISGDLRSRYNDIRGGLVKFIVTPPEGSDKMFEQSRRIPAAFKAVEFASGVFYTSGNTLGFELGMHCEDSEGAEELKKSLDGFKALAEQSVKGSSEEGSEDLANLLESITIERSGDIVTITIEESADTIKEAIKSSSSAAIQPPA